LHHAEEWDAASRETEHVANGQAPRLRSPRIDQWTAQYALRHVEVLTDLGRDAEAAPALARARDAVELLRPTARLGEGAVAALRMRLGDAFVRLGNLDAGAEQFHLAIDDVGATFASTRAPTLHADLAMRLAVVTAIGGDVERSVLELREAVALGASPDSLGTIAARLARTRAQRTLVGEALRRLDAGDSNANRSMRLARLQFAAAPIANVSAGATRDLIVSDTLFELGPSDAPFVVEADARLFAGYDDVTASHPLFTTWLPAMRDRILGEIGIRIPGVSVRASDALSEGAYVISLHGVAVVAGAIQPGKRFVVPLAAGDAVGGRVLKISDLSASPEDGGLGAWIDPLEAQSLDRAGVDAFALMTRQIELVARFNLETFFGVQELAGALDEWRNAPTAESERTMRDTLVRAATSTADGASRLLAAFRHLLHERTPVRRVDALLRCVVDAPAEREPMRIADAYRRSIREELAVQDGDRRQWLLLSDAFEHAVADSIFAADGKEVFAIHGSRVTELLGAVRTAMTEADQNTVIVARRDGIRPYVRRLLEGEFPMLVVLASNELASPPATDTPIVLLPNERLAAKRAEGDS
jgi:hypothetical protein